MAVSVKWFRMVELHTLPYSPDVNPCGGFYLLLLPKKTTIPDVDICFKVHLADSLFSGYRMCLKSLFNCTQLSVFQAWIVM